MSEINLIELQTGRIIGVRIAKTMAGLPAGVHRMSIEPGRSAKEACEAIDSDLSRMGIDPIADWAPLHAMIAVTHTTEVIAAFRKVAAAAKTDRTGNVSAADAGT